MMALPIASAGLQWELTAIPPTVMAKQLLRQNFRCIHGRSGFNMHSSSRITLQQSFHGLVVVLTQHHFC